MIESIKEIAHKIAEEYLLTGDDMNEALLDSYQSGEIENLEVLKRICETANQNVYLALYQNDDTDKTNITFVLADYDKLKGEIQKGEKDMDKYLTPPNDFRGLLTMVAGEAPKEIPESSDGGEKVAEIHKLGQYKNVFEAFFSDIQSLRTHEEMNADRAFEKMSLDAKTMIANGESLGDISKVACRFVRDEGYDFKKVALAYDMIHRELLEKNFKVNTSFTKTSSIRRINRNADMLQPVNEYISSVEKIAALNDMLKNLGHTVSKMRELFTEKIKQS